MGYILIKNSVVTDEQSESVKDVLIKDSEILKVDTDIDSSKIDNVRIIDASGLYCLPGLIDAHTHFHLVSRGTFSSDDFANGSKIACIGGITTVVDFADHYKGKTLTESFKTRLDEMKDTMAIDFTLHQGVYGHGYNSEIPEQLELLKKMGVKTLKIFTTYRETGYLLDDPQKLSDLFKHARELGLLVTAHCEYNPLIEKIASQWKGTYVSKDHADLRPDEAEAQAIRFYGTSAMENDCPFYVVHLSSEAGLNEIRKLRKQGAVVYAETTPTYLFLDRSKLEGERGPLYIMTPPLRTKKDNEALQEAVLNGEIQVIATDHCPYTKEEKMTHPDVRSTYPGIPGIEELFLLMNTFREKNSDKMSMKDLVSMMSFNPAKLFGLYPQKGSLKEGTDADIVLFDPKGKRVLKDEDAHTLAKYTPYDGFEVSGKVCMTMLRGKIMYENGNYCGKDGDGRFLKQV